MKERINALLKRRGRIDAELATESGLEISLFNQVHTKCSNVTTIIVGKSYAGYSATWSVNLYNPKYAKTCPTHNVQSAEWVDTEKILN